MLPEKFEKRMRLLLGSEYEDFKRTLTEEAPVRGFRVNKIKVKDSAPIFSVLGKDRVPYEESGFTLKDGLNVGMSPLHHCGAIYMQDPGAMAALSAIDIPEGIWAIDLCAAPGGKSSKIAESIGDKGFLLSNEYVPKRAKALVGNFERLGIKNAIVTSLDTSEFPKLFDGAFELVVADVPCSGEGMFRKNEEAVRQWSEENVLLCSKRQREILENAAPLVKVGGTLLYSTCTFSLEENENTVIDFLKRHGEFELAPVAERLLPYTSAAINTDGEFPELACCARRFYPHISNGEGQFVAVLKRRNTGDRQRGVLFREDIKVLTKAEESTVVNFLNTVFAKKPCGRLMKQGENIILISHGGVLPPKSVFSAGILLGQIKGSLLFPSHQLFSAFGRDFKLKVDLDISDVRLEKYLCGEETDVGQSIKGWCAVTVGGIPLGGAKASAGRLKNHYPKGLRNTR